MADRRGREATWLRPLCRESRIAAWFETVVNEVIMARTAVTIGFSVPPELASEIERMAQTEGRTKSELFREMVRVYRRERELAVFEDLATYGRGRARQAGVLSEEDVERLIHEARGV
jgi:predicted DNA-binding protein